MNYYNEFDPKAAAWLKQLIEYKQIPQGHVDSRSILEVVPADLAGFTQCHFFAGIGGWSLALRLAGIPTTEPLWTASLPCQPFSAAGKQRGTEDERHLAPVFLELVRQCRPANCFGEQVASKLARTDWLPGIRLELEALGYSFGAADLCAPCAGEIGEGRIVRGDSESWERVIIGHPHIRQRLYWVADSRHDLWRGRTITDRTERSSPPNSSWMGESNIEGCEGSHDHGESSRGIQCLSAKPSGDGGLANPSGGDELRESRSGNEGIGSCGEPLGRGLQQADSDGSHSGLPHTRSGGREMEIQPARNGGSEICIGETVRSGVYGTPNFTFLHCRDGKTRRTESGIFPLVDGLPRGVVPSGDPSDPNYTNSTAEGRAMRLKGYGNAIVPPLAAMFIKSYMEARNQ